jgi:hypothetical protein
LNSSDDLLILRSSCCLVPGFFICLQPRSCCHRLQSLMPLLHSGPFQRLFACFLYHTVLVVSSLVILSPVPCNFCTVGHPLAGCGQFLLQSTNSLGLDFPDDVSLTPCHCYMTGHLPAGSSQLPLGSTISSGQFLSLSASPCS